MVIKDEIYPNQPLIEVVFEVRFPGEVRVECEKHLFWEKIRDEYPNVLVPRPDIEKAIALLPYRFRNADGTMTVMVAINTLAISASVPYPGYQKFSKEILRIYDIFQSLFNLKKINRVGWRYVNVIPFVRKNGVIPLSSILNIGFKVPSSVPEEFKNLDMVFESEHEGCSVITKLQTIQRQHDKLEEALLLDFDFGKVSTNDSELTFDKVPKYLEEAHKKTRQLFEDFITDDYRQYLRGDVI